MEKKKNNLITAFLIVSWLSVAFFSLLYLSARVQNFKLKNTLATQAEKIQVLSEQNKVYEETNKRAAQYQDNALNYLEWQFVLNDQVSQAATRLKQEAGRIKGLSQDKELLNFLYYNLGLSYILAMDFNSAIKAFEQAIRVMPNDTNSYYNLGLLFSTYNQDPKQAVRYYEKYLELSPSGEKAEEVKDRLKVLKTRSK